MKTNAKAKVAVLYGGQSSEHEVSLLSAASVIEYLDRNLFEIIPIGIDKQGSWFINDIEQVYFSGEKRLQVKAYGSSLVNLNNNKLIRHQLDTFKLPCDVAFPMMHGQFCEDGCLQGLLELANVAYVGAGVLASAIGMDKDVSKRLVQAAGITTPKYMVLKESQGISNWKALAREVDIKLGFPVFIKPAHLGSSVGIHKAMSASELAKCISNGFKYDNKLLIEQAIEALKLNYRY